MTFEMAELAGLGAVVTALGGGLWRGLVLILQSAKEQRDGQAAMAEKMTDALTAMQRDAHKVIERNTLASERQAVATRDLTEAVERLTGRVELVERVVAKTETKRFDRAG